jgi:uncharacterized lipoprotein YddW (UPF0748 family)
MLSSSFLAAAMLAGAQSFPAPPAPPREFRAAWVATVANIDWPSRSNLTSAQGQAELRAVFERADRMNLNAVIFQIRPKADAFYASKLEPWSEFLTGRQGNAPSPAWDPLQFAIDEAHSRGMELHVWFNPYRAGHPSAKGPYCPTHISRTQPGLVKPYGKHLWMDPAEPQVQAHSLNVMLDVVRRYDIDGVHIDDYFYPYKERDAKGNVIDFPDGPSWQRYRASGGTLARDDWRRAQVDGFVKKLYDGIKAEKRWVKFGISPFGVYRPGVPAGITAGVDQYRDLYADARKWLVEGWCDYYTPQLYWKIDSKGQSYPVLLNWWVSQNVKGRHMWPGNFTTQVGAGFGNWSPQEIVRQVEITQKTAGATGNVHFSMRAFTQDFKGLSGMLRDGPYRSKALVPASPWLDASSPAAPSLVVRVAGDRAEVSWTMPANSKPLRGWALWTRHGAHWSFQPLPLGTRSASVPGQAQQGALNAVAVAAVDRVGNAGPNAVWAPLERGETTIVAKAGAPNAG